MRTHRNPRGYLRRIQGQSTGDTRHIKGELQAPWIIPGGGIHVSLQSFRVEIPEGERVRGKGHQAVLPQQACQGIKSIGVAGQDPRHRGRKIKPHTKNGSRGQSLPQGQGDLADALKDRGKILPRMEIQTVAQPNRAVGKVRVLEAHY